MRSVWIGTALTEVADDSACWAALRCIQEELAQVLDAGQITAVCRDVGYQFRQRLLDPVATIHLFVIQILNGNFAVARLKDFTDADFSEAAVTSQFP